MLPCIVAITLMYKLFYVQRLFVPFALHSIVCINVPILFCVLHSRFEWIRLVLDYYSSLRSCVFFVLFE